MITTTDAAVAAQLRQEVESHGGRMAVATTTLLALFAAEDLSEANIDRILAALDDESITTRPALTRASVNGQVTLELSDRSPGPEEDEAQLESGQEAPQGPTPADAVTSQAAALPVELIAAGVVIPGLVVSAAGFVAWWGFGVLFLIASAIAWWAFRPLRFLLAKIFLFPFRSLRLAAFMLGATPMLVVLAVLSLAVVVPVAAQRADDARERDARALLVEADDALERGDLRRADDLLDEARRKDAGVAGLSATDERARQLRAEQEEERVNNRAYEAARAAFDDGDYGTAIGGMRDLDGYRDSSDLVDRYASEGAADLREQARAALAGRRYDEAIRLADEAQDLRVTGPGADILRQANAGKAEARARARARAEARREAARLRAEARRLAREQRAAERQRQREIEEAQAAAPAYDAPDVDAPSGNWCGASRDGDGDGIWCEG